MEEGGFPTSGAVEKRKFFGGSVKRVFPIMQCLPLSVGADRFSCTTLLLAQPLRRASILLNGASVVQPWSRVLHAATIERDRVDAGCRGDEELMLGPPPEAEI